MTASGGTASGGTASGRTTIRGHAVTPDGVLEDAVVRIDGGHIVEVGTAGDADLTAAWIVPGFVDLHVHGGGGHTFTSGDPDEARAAAAFHYGHGTTTLQASLVTASPAATRAAVAGLAPLVHSGLLAGVHLEGPYLSTARCGAQNPAYLRDPDPDELADLLAFGVVRTVTIAPELPGSLTAIRQLSAHGVIAAIGHTDATYEQTLDAIEAGASLATHLCNAMRPIHHRDPGPIVALLDAPSVVCEQIADGVHLHDGMFGHVVRVAGPDRIALITDAIAATGMADGDYELGGQRVVVDRGVARLASNGTIAGSTLTMDAALRRAVDSGVSIVDAVRMASTTPARVLGRSAQIGAIAEGLRADLVLLDQDLQVIQVLT
jgi:N-acetylglucosamine-6-phosphate deacetylase